MNRRVYKIVKTVAVLVLAGTAGVAVSHAFGQGRDDGMNFVPPSPSGPLPLYVPPSPSESIAPRVTAPAPSTAPTAATAPKSSNSTTPPYGYSRFRPTLMGPRKTTTQPSPQSSPTPIRQASAEFNSQDPNRFSVRQADASSWTGLAANQVGGPPARKGAVTPAGHIDSMHDPNSDPSLGPPPDIGRGGLLNRPGGAIPGAGMTFPTDRPAPPSIRGSHLGLLAGETATERSMRLMQAVGELERQLDGANQRNTELSEIVRQRDDQLLLAIREIKSTRRDVSSAKDELERLRDQVKNLQDKVLTSERDNTALLQTMAPLLYQLLNADASSNGRSEE